MKLLTVPGLALFCVIVAMAASADIMPGVEWHVANATRIEIVRADDARRVRVTEVLKGVDLEPGFILPAGNLQPGQSAVALFPYQYPGKPEYTPMSVWPMDADGNVHTHDVPAESETGFGLRSDDFHVKLDFIKNAIAASSPEEAGLNSQVLEAIQGGEQFRRLERSNPRRAAYVRLVVAVLELSASPSSSNSRARWPAVPDDLRAPSDAFPQRLIDALQKNDMRSFAPAYAAWLDSGVRRDREIHQATLLDPAIVRDSNLQGAIGGNAYLPPAPRLRPDIVLNPNIPAEDRMKAIALFAQIRNYDRFNREREAARALLASFPGDSEVLRSAAFWELRDVNVNTPGRAALQRLAENDGVKTQRFLLALCVNQYLDDDLLDVARIEIQAGRQVFTDGLSAYESSHNDRTAQWIRRFLPGGRKAPVQERRLGLMPPEYSQMTRLKLTTSDDGLHVALATRRGGKAVMFCDGREGRAYDDIAGNLAVFGPGGKRFEYVARKGGKFVMVIDDQEGPEYDEILVKGPPFSANDSLTAYVARTGSKEAVVVNNQEQMEFDTICNGWVNFSSDGNHYAYVARQNGRFVALVDGRQTMEFSGSELGGTVLSADGRHAGYSARKVNRWSVIVDGKEGPAFDYVYGPYFSADGRRWACIGQNSNAFRIVVDGKEGPRYAGLMAGSPFGGPDGKLVAYWATTSTPSGTKEVIVVNGKESAEHDEVGSPVISPNGKRLACVGCYGRLLPASASIKGMASKINASVMLDGVEGPHYDGIVSGPIFSPDSRRLAYVARKTLMDGKPVDCVVVDGKEGRAYERVSEFLSAIVFSPDSRRLGYIAWRGGKRLVVVDETEGQEYRQRRH